NSAPVKTKKFETKYMVPIIVLAVSTVGLAAFLIVELFILKPEELKTKEKAVRDSIPTVSTTTNDLADTIAEECETSTTETSPTIPFSSNDSIDDTGPYTLSANGPAGVSVASTNTSSSAQLTVNWSQAKTAYPNLSTSTGTDNYSITFTQPITDIYYGTIGEKSFFFFILKNGTVDYIDIQQSLNDKNFSVSGPINGVTNIAKFISSTSDNAPTVLAQKINGTYYDLKSYLE
ncbi:hypothetical protein IJ096_02775, partial [Candidatus Saccharibacteria bacterium]|nr:hypothetical protein [Candidatus Saccharibacteria bacterium]